MLYVHRPKLSQLLYKMLDVMKATPPKLSGLIFLATCKLQCNIWNVLLFITGVAFYLPLHSSNYFSIMKKGKFSTNNTSLQKIYTTMTSSISEHHHLYYIHREKFIYSHSYSSLSLCVDKKQVSSLICTPYT